MVGFIDLSCNLAANRCPLRRIALYPSQFRALAEAAFTAAFSARSIAGRFPVARGALVFGRHRDVASNDLGRRRRSGGRPARGTVVRIRRMASWLAWRSRLAWRMERRLESRLAWRLARPPLGLASGLSALRSLWRLRRVCGLHPLAAGANTVGLPVAADQRLLLSRRIRQALAWLAGGRALRAPEDARRPPERTAQIGRRTIRRPRPQDFRNAD